MMNIEIRQPRLEALLQQRMASGQFANVEDAILQALESSLVQSDTESAHSTESQIGIRPPGFGRSLVQVFSEARDFAVDLDISRDPSPGRAVDFS